MSTRVLILMPSAGVSNKKGARRVAVVLASCAFFKAGGRPAVRFNDPTGARVSAGAAAHARAAATLAPRWITHGTSATCTRCARGAASARWRGRSRSPRALRARVHHPHVDAHAARLGVGDTAGRVAGVRGDAAAAVGAGGGDAPPLARAPARGGRRRGGGVDPWGVFAPPGSEARWAGARAPKHLFPAAFAASRWVSHTPPEPPPTRSRATRCGSRRCSCRTSPRAPRRARSSQPPPRRRKFVLRRRRPPPPRPLAHDVDRAYRRRGLHVRFARGALRRCARCRRRRALGPRRRASGGVRTRRSAEAVPRQARRRARVRRGRLPDDTSPSS